MQHYNSEQEAYFAAIRSDDVETIQPPHPVCTADRNEQMREGMQSLMAALYGKKYTTDQLLTHSGDISQTIGSDAGG
jgi:hypothetical protein